mmetsp:Transcript_26612/g.61915  ORF Transcript_26612/g.61915 Transcript_26612/m.61915 type:complete len:195 (+) Transcript_26612:896-1480(+)
MRACLKPTGLSCNSVNGFNGTLPSEMGRLTLLRGLWMHQNSFTGSIPTEFGNLQNMRDFRLYRNALVGPIPEEFYQLSSFLSVFEIHRNALTGTLSTKIGRFRNLQFFCISRNQLTGTIPEQIASLRNLRRAWLHLNRFVGSVPNIICDEIVGPGRLQFLQADCFPEVDPPNPCSCCTRCCDREIRNCTTVRVY